MNPIQSPTPRLVAGFAAIILIAVVSSLFVRLQLSELRRMQRQTMDRNRKDSVLLLRLQRQVDLLGQAMRSVAAGDSEPPLRAWREDMAELRKQIAAALDPADAQIAQVLANLESAEAGLIESEQLVDPARSRAAVLAALQAEQSALTRSVAAVMRRHAEEEAATAQQIYGIYDDAERNRYIFMTVLIVLAAGISFAAANYNRHIFDRLRAVSEERQMLARGLITVQEEVLRTVSRELHDEFGQILTAINALLHRAGRKHLPDGSPARADLEEVRAITQETLEKTREFSQSLRPAILDDYGLAKAVERQVQAFEKHYGIPIELDSRGCADLPPQRSIHVYRVLQEALSNVARHSQATAANVRFTCDEEKITLEILDNGIGINSTRAKGLGLIAMRERAELLQGRVAVERRPEGGTRVSLKVPLQEPNE